VLSLANHVVTDAIQLLILRNLRSRQSGMKPFEVI